MYYIHQKANYLIFTYLFSILFLLPSSLYSQSIRISPDGKILATADGDKLNIWRIDSESLLFSLNSYELSISPEYIKDIHFKNPDTLLLVCINDHKSYTIHGLKIKTSKNFLISELKKGIEYKYDNIDIFEDTHSKEFTFIYNNTARSYKYKDLSQTGIWPGEAYYAENKIYFQKYHHSLDISSTSFIILDLLNDNVVYKSIDDQRYFSHYHNNFAFINISKTEKALLITDYKNFPSEDSIIVKTYYTDLAPFMRENGYKYAFHPECQFILFQDNIYKLDEDSKRLKPFPKEEKSNNSTSSSLRIELIPQIGFTENLTKISFSPSGKYMACANGSKIIIYDLKRHLIGFSNTEITTYSDDAFQFIDDDQIIVGGGIWNFKKNKHYQIFLSKMLDKNLFIYHYGESYLTVMDSLFKKITTIYLSDEENFIIDAFYHTEKKSLLVFTKNDIRTYDFTNIFNLDSYTRRPENQFTHELGNVLSSSLQSFNTDYFGYISNDTLHLIFSKWDETAIHHIILDINSGLLTKEQINILLNNIRSIRLLDVSQKEDFFAFKDDNDYLLKIFDFKKGEVIATIGKESEVAQFSDLSNLLVHSDYHGKVILTDLNRFSTLHTINPLEIEHDHIRNIVFHPASPKILSGRFESLFEWDLTTLNPEKIPVKTEKFLKYTQDGNFIVTADNMYRHLKLYNTDSGEEYIKTFTEFYTPDLMDIQSYKDNIYVFYRKKSKQIKLSVVPIQDDASISNYTLKSSFNDNHDYDFKSRFNNSNHIAITSFKSEGFELIELSEGNIKSSLIKVPESKNSTKHIDISEDGRFVVLSYNEGYSNHAIKSLKIDFTSGETIKLNRELRPPHMFIEDPYIFASTNDGYINIEKLELIPGTSLSIPYNRYKSFDANIKLGLLGGLNIEKNSLDLYSLESGEMTHRLTHFDTSNYIVVTADNYYMGSRQSIEKLALKINDEVYPLGSFDIYLNRPDILLERLNLAENEYIEAYRKAYEKRLSRMNNLKAELDFTKISLPSVNISNKHLPNLTNDPEISFKVTATDTVQFLYKVDVILNGVPLYGEQGIKTGNTSFFNKEFRLRLSQGLNIIKVNVTNKKGITSVDEKFQITYEAIEEDLPDLYLISVSVSKYEHDEMSLQYAVKDGRDLTFLLSKSKDFKNIYIDTLFDKNATRENIIELKQKLINSKVDDQVILFISGHGLLDDNLDFYFATHDIDFDNPAERGISYDQLEWLLDSIPARKKLFMMDACHSGEVDREELIALNDLKEKKGLKSGLKSYTYRAKVLEEDENKGIGLQNSFELMQELFTNLNRGSGAVVISAAAGDSYALESDEWNNGVFTYSVLDGLKNEHADLNNNGEITVSELRNYVSKKVQEETGGRQKPTARQENVEFDFRVW